MYPSTAVLSLFIAVYGGFTAKAEAEVWPNAFGGYRSSSCLCSVLCHFNESDCTEEPRSSQKLIQIAQQRRQVA
jgi:hypothetical protein